MSAGNQSTGRLATRAEHEDQQLDNLRSTYRQEVDHLKTQIERMGEHFEKQQSLYEEQIRLLKLQIEQLVARNRHLESRSEVVR